MESSRLGLILDTSVVIAAERRGHSVRQIFEHIQAGQGAIELCLSVVTIAELMHGAQRAETNAQKQRRVRFIGRLCIDIPVHPMTIEIARMVGEIKGQQAAHGNTIAFEDLVIGATALYLGFDVATLNVRHFERIPGLKIVSI